MVRMRTIRLALLVFGMSICAIAQTSSQSQTETTPAPAFGQNAPMLNPENPPVSGLDEPRLELGNAGGSFISPALQVSESADTNGGNQFGNTGLESITSILGALDLQQFWPKSDLFLEYLGGGAFYSSPYDVQQLQAVGLQAVTRWRTGQVTVRDSFSYLPDGSFSMGTYGGFPGLGLTTGSMGLGGQGGALPGGQQFGNGQFGSVENIPLLANTAILDVEQSLSPVSAITAAGGFSNAHFYDSANCSNPENICLIDSDQVTIQGGYSRLLSRHDQIGGIYDFQRFQFPQSTGGRVTNQVANVLWSHTLTGRMSFSAGAGPQHTDLQQSVRIKSWSVSARVELRYRFAHSSMAATYEKFTSTGSGFFAGADTQAARFEYTRSLGRTWNFYGDLGYSHNKNLQLGFVGVNASNYDEGFAGAVFRKHLGRSYDFFAAYRFSEVAFNVPACFGGSCGNNAQQHIGTVGVEWHPRPTRIE
ncbi:MAG: hypothetical protein ABSG23_13905 [Terriglobales bacterium]